MSRPTAYLLGLKERQTTCHISRTGEEPRTHENPVSFALGPASEDDENAGPQPPVALPGRESSGWLSGGGGSRMDGLACVDFFLSFLAALVAGALWRQPAA